MNIKIPIVTGNNDLEFVFTKQSKLNSSMSISLGCEGFSEDSVYFELISGELFDKKECIVGSLSNENDIKLKISIFDNYFAYYVNDKLCKSNLPLLNQDINLIKLDDEIQNDYEIKSFISHQNDLHEKKCLFITTDTGKYTGLYNVLSGIYRNVDFASGQYNNINVEISSGNFLTESNYSLIVFGYNEYEEYSKYSKSYWNNLNKKILYIGAEKISQQGFDLISGEYLDFIDETGELKYINENGRRVDEGDLVFSESKPQAKIFNINDGGVLSGSLQSVLDGRWYISGTHNGRIKYILTPYDILFEMRWNTDGYWEIIRPSDGFVTHTKEEDVMYPFLGSVPFSGPMEAYQPVIFTSSILTHMAIEWQNKSTDYLFSPLNKENIFVLNDIYESYVESEQEEADLYLNYVKNDIPDGEGGFLYIQEDFAGTYNKDAFINNKPSFINQNNYEIYWSEINSRWELAREYNYLNVGGSFENSIDGRWYRSDLINGKISFNFVKQENEYTMMYYYSEVPFFEGWIISGLGNILYQKEETVDLPFLGVVNFSGFLGDILSVNRDLDADLFAFNTSQDYYPWFNTEWTVEGDYNSSIITGVITNKTGTVEVYKGILFNQDVFSNKTYQILHNISLLSL